MPNWSSKNLSEILKRISKALIQAFSKQNAVVENEAPSFEVTITKDQPVERKPQETTAEPPIQELSKTEELDSGFLICPIQDKDSNGQPVTPYTVKISAVLDHSGTEIDPNSNNHWGKRAKDQKIKAFNEETGEGTQCPQEPCGYQKKDGGEFFKNKEINYVGVSSDGGKNTLQYDGHAGYDFPYSPMTPIIAPASGCLFKAANGKDKIYGAEWSKDHSFYIEHENGFMTWFRHCTKLVEQIENTIGTDFNKSVRVNQNQLIACTGKFENWKADGTSAHLHFEARNKDGKIVDPYKDKLWK